MYVFRNWLKDCLTTELEETYLIIEHCCLGWRRLHLFGRDDNLRTGWVLVGQELASMRYRRGQLSFTDLIWDLIRIREFFYLLQNFAEDKLHWADIIYSWNKFIKNHIMYAIKLIFSEIQDSAKVSFEILGFVNLEKIWNCCIIH